MDERIKEQIRDANDIVDVVNECVPLKKAGTAYKACCPFHDEKTPSFTVGGRGQMWHCFGCDQGGDVFTFVMKFYGMTFPEALRHLANRAGITVPEQRERRSDVARDDVLRVLRRYADWYQDVLLRQDAGEAAREYLRTRGIHADEAKTFGLGYAPDAWTAACEHPALRELDRKHLLAAGLAKPRSDQSLYDYFRNRIIFPIHGPGGDVVAFGGRTIGDDAAKYINSPETSVYSKGSQLYNLFGARQAIQHAGCAILVEGYIDAIRLAVAGVEHVVATCGTALTPQQAKVLGRHTERVLVAYDGDAAGRAAAIKAAGLLLEAGLEVGCIALPEGQDPDDYVAAEGADGFLRLAEAADDFVDFLLRDTPNPRTLSIDVRAAFADRLLELANRIDHAVRRGLYLEKIAARLDVTVRDLQRAGGLARSEPAPEGATAARPVNGVVSERDRDLLGYLLEHLDRLAEHRALAEAGDHPLVRAVIARVFAQDPPYASAQAVHDGTDDPGERALIREVAVGATGDRRRYPSDWVTGHVDLRTIKPRTRDLIALIREAETAGDETRVRELTREYAELQRDKHARSQALRAVQIEP